MLEASREMPDRSWQEEKQAGNAYFKAKEFVSASRCYGFGIVRLKEDQKMPETDKCANLAVMFSNRSMAFLKLRKWEDVVDDATVAIAWCRKLVKKHKQEPNATYYKSLYRRAQAQEKLQRDEDALEDWEALLAAPLELQGGAAEKVEALKSKMA